MHTVESGDLVQTVEADLQSLGTLGDAEVASQLVESHTTGQILEYFRDTEFSKPLEILASWDHLLDDFEIINAFSQNYRRLNIQAIERDIEMLIAKERWHPIRVHEIL